MKVAVTGGSGQLGTLVLRRLAADRRVKEVVSIDLHPPRVPLGKVRMVLGDVRDAGLASEIAGCDALIHLAFVVTALRPRAEFDDINVGGSKNVFRLAAAAGVRKILYSSSVAAYGVLPGHPVPITEDAPRRHQPAFAYAANKFEVEAFLDEFEREHPEIAVARLRPSILIGARMEHELGRHLRQRVLLSICDAPLPIVWDEDVADAIMLALIKGARGAFNLCADDLLSARDLAAACGFRHLHVPLALVRAAAGVQVRVAALGLGRAADPAWVDTANVAMIPTSARAREVLGWRPRCRTAVEVMQEFDRVTPRRLHGRLRAFFRLVHLFGRRPEPNLAGFTSRVHLQLSGPQGGDIGIAAASGRLQVGLRPPRPPDAVVTLPATLFLDLLGGRADFSAALLTGRIRVEGQGHAGMLISGMVGTFRSSARLPGAPGLLGRALLRMIG